MSYRDQSSSPCGTCVWNPCKVFLNKEFRNTTNFFFFFPFKGSRCQPVLIDLVSCARAGNASPVSGSRAVNEAGGFFARWEVSVDTVPMGINPEQLWVTVSHPGSSVCASWPELRAVSSTAPCAVQGAHEPAGAWPSTLCVCSPSGTPHTLSQHIQKYPWPVSTLLCTSGIFQEEQGEKGEQRDTGRKYDIRNSRSCKKTKVVSNLLSLGYLKWKRCLVGLKLSSRSCHRDCHPRALFPPTKGRDSQVSPSCPTLPSLPVLQKILDQGIPVTGQYPATLFRAS